MNPEILSTAAVIAQEFNLEVKQVEAIIELLIQGYEIAFIHRYRKQLISGISPRQLQQLTLRLEYLQELNQRKHTIKELIEKQGQLSETLAKAIHDANSKSRLEDIFLPFRSNKTNREETKDKQELKALAQKILTISHIDLETETLNYLDAKSIDKNSLMQELQPYLIELLSEDALSFDHLRQYLWQQGVLKSKGEKQKKGSYKFNDYLNFSQAINKIPFYKVLALFKGRREGILKLELLSANTNYPEEYLKSSLNVESASPELKGLLTTCIRQTWQRRWHPKLQLELFNRLKESADSQAIALWSRQLEDLLLTPPAGAKVILGLDTSNRAAIEAAVIDETGKLLDYASLFPFHPDGSWQESLVQLAKLALLYKVELIGIGNGSAFKDTERLIAALIKTYPDLNIKKITVNQAGAQAYATSKEASKELPEIRTGIKSAVSIARRVQNTLAELTKITPNAIEIGSYQTEVNQTRLTAGFNAAIKHAVNVVGVDINQASVHVLSYVCGLDKDLAKNLVEYRQQKGHFTSRTQLKNIPGWQEKNVEQASGFLKIINADNLLDATAVHPDQYSLVEKMARDNQLSVNDLLANTKILASINPKDYLNENCLATVVALLKELQKPGFDPRGKFRIVEFAPSIETINDLKLGMKLPGVVSNLTTFGVFINMGIYQDGLIHLSTLKAYPKLRLKTGNIVQVKIIDIDKKTNRIGLDLEIKPISSTKQKAIDIHYAQEKSSKKVSSKKISSLKNHNPRVFNTVMAEALMKLKSRKS